MPAHEWYSMRTNRLDDYLKCPNNNRDYPIPKRIRDETKYCLGCGEALTCKHKRTGTVYYREHTYDPLKEMGKRCLDCGGKL